MVGGAMLNTRLWVYHKQLLPPNANLPLPSKWLRYWTLFKMSTPSIPILMEGCRDTLWNYDTMTKGSFFVVKAQAYVFNVLASRGDSPQRVLNFKQKFWSSLLHHRSSLWRLWCSAHPKSKWSIYKDTRGSRYLVSSTKVIVARPGQRCALY